jgi:hypothetical protein
MAKYTEMLKRIWKEELGEVAMKLVESMPGRIAAVIEHEIYRYRKSRGLNKKASATFAFGGKVLGTRVQLCLCGLFNTSYDLLVPQLGRGGDGLRLYAWVVRNRVASESNQLRGLVLE